MLKKRISYGRVRARLKKNTSLWEERRLYNEYSGYAKELVNFSEKLLSAKKHGAVKGRLIFLGQGMRPLFEAIAALNNKRKIIPKKEIRYFITPFSFGVRHIKMISREPELISAIGRVSQELIRRRIVDKKTKQYILVDCIYEGSGVGLIGEAIKLAMGKQAEVKQLSQRNYSEFGLLEAEATAINVAEKIPRPTDKSESEIVRILPSGYDTARTNYLLFQRILQQEIRKRK